MKISAWLWLSPNYDPKQEGQEGTGGAAILVMRIWYERGKQSKFFLVETKDI